MNSIRREQLREYIEINHIVTMRQLTDLLPDVSLMTIHRDLTFLQSQGLIEKIRGGARYIASGTAEATFSAREIVGREAKAVIAQKAIGLLGDEGSIFVDAGTTMMAFAKVIPDHKRSVVTTGPNIALELAAKQNMTITLCGGTLNKSNLTLSGSAAMETLSGFNIDTAYIVASGYSPGAGFTCGMESEARIKSLVIRKARTVIMLMDGAKLNRVLPYTFAQLSDLDYLITEQNPDALPPELIQAADGVAVLY